MRRRDPAPQGLVGAGATDSVLVHLSMGIKSEKGFPMYKGRFWFMTQTTRSVSYGSYSSPTRDPHPAFAEWNAGARALGKDIPPAGPGRYGIVHGNLVASSLVDVARWSRVCQKGPAGTTAPPSRRPWCEGDGTRAKRFVKVEGEEEVFKRIACPNEDCEFAMAKACKPAAHLVFMIREEGFPSLLCEWSSNGWESLSALRGFFEEVLGTAAILTAEEVAAADAEERATWKRGLAAEFGIAEPSLFGLPFVAVITERTKPAKKGETSGTRYPVVHFGLDGNPAEFFLAQRRQMEALAGGGARPPLALPSVQDRQFEEVARHDSRVEIQPDFVEPADLVTLPAEVVAELRALAGRLEVSWDAVEERLGGSAIEFAGPSEGFLRARVEDTIEALRG